MAASPDAKNPTVPLPPLVPPTAMPLFPDFLKAFPLLQAIFANLPLPHLPGFFPNLPPQFPGFPGFPGCPPLLLPDPTKPPPFFQPPKKTETKKSRAKYNKKEDKNPLPTGPPFQLDFVPHLKEAVQPMKRVREESPDIIILEGPIFKKPRINEKAGRRGRGNQKPQTTRNVQNFMMANLLPQPDHQNLMQLPPTFVPPLLPYVNGILPPLFTIENFAQRPTNPIMTQAPQIPIQRPNIPAPMTPNQRAYAIIENAFPSWKYDYFKKRAMIAHTNCLLKRRMCWLAKKPGMLQELNDIERRFRVAKVNIFVMLTPEEREQTCVLFLKNCVSYFQKLDEKEKEMEQQAFLDWMETQLNYEPIKPFYFTQLPTFEQVLTAIRDSFQEMKLIDCTETQKQQLINCLQYDWTDPELCPQRLQTFSNIIGLTPERIVEILEEARTNLKNLIYVRDYYWSIDQPLPPFDY